MAVLIELLIWLGAVGIDDPFGEGSIIRLIRHRQAGPIPHQLEHHNKQTRNEVPEKRLEEQRIATVCKAESTNYGRYGQCSSTRKRNRVWSAAILTERRPHHEASQPVNDCQTSYQLSANKHRAEKQAPPRYKPRQTGGPACRAWHPSVSCGIIGFVSHAPRAFVLMRVGPTIFARWASPLGDRFVWITRHYFRISDHFAVLAASRAPQSSLSPIMLTSTADLQNLLGHNLL